MDKYLPIGSVVLLKEGTKRLMICGRIQVKSENEVIYDYSGCYYPEGILNSEEMFLFNHDVIERIYFLGFQDSEEIEFSKHIENKMNEYKKMNESME